MLALLPKKLDRPQFITTDAKAMASSVHKNDTLHHGASYAVDSDVSTSWTAGDSLAWITVALDREATFDKWGYGTIEFSLPEPLFTGSFRMNIQQSNGRPSIYSIRLK